MDEEKLKQGFTPPPTADELVSEPKKSNIPNSHHYLMIAVIAVIVFLVGGAVVWFYPGTEEIVEEKYLSEEISLYTTKTTICEEQSYDTCNLREEFEKGETILVVTEVIPSIDLDLDVDISFTVDLKLPNGDVLEQFFEEYKREETIPAGELTIHGEEIITNEADLSGEYTIYITLTDNTNGNKEVIEKTFTLYDYER